MIEDSQRMAQGFCLAIALVLQCCANAQDIEPRVEANSQEVRDLIEASLSLAIPTQYFFRGLQQENQGIIVQPGIDIGVSLYEGGDNFGGLTLNFGLWNSLHEGPTGNSGRNREPTLWYEADFYAGLSADFFQNLNFGITFASYTSPNDSFATVDELTGALSYNDSDLWGDSFGGLQPHVSLSFELENQMEGGTSRGVYLQFGVEPAFEFGTGSEYPVTLAIPVTVGLSLSEYFEHPVTGRNSTFGFLDVGADLSTPLAFMPDGLGSWTGTLGAHALFLDGATEAINNGDSFEFIISIGLSCSF